MADNVIIVRSAAATPAAARLPTARPDLETARGLGRRAEAFGEIGDATRQVAEGMRAMSGGLQARGRGEAAIGAGVADLGAGVSDFGGSLAGVFEVFETARQEHALAEATNSAVSRLNDAARGGRGGDIGGSIAGFDSQAAAIKTEIVESLRSEREKREFGAHFDALHAARRERVRSAAIAATRDAGRAELSGAVEQLLREAAAADSEEARLAVSAVAEQRIRQAADTGIISLTQAENLRQTFAQGSAEVRARQLIGENPHAARLMLDDHGQLTGLDPLRREQLIAMADTAIAKRTTQVTAGLRDDIQEMESAAAQGLPVAAKRIQDAKAGASLLGDEKLATRIDRFAAVSAFQERLQQLSLPEAQQTLADLEAGAAAAGDASPLETAQIEAGRATLNRMNTELARDPLVFATSAGVIAVNPLTIAEDGSVDALSQRRDQALTVAEHYGVAPKFFTSEERGALKAALSSGTAERREAIVTRIVAGFGSYAPEALAEISDDAPAASQFGGLATLGPQHGLTVRDGFRGLEAIEAQALDMPSRDTTMLLMEEVLDGAIDSRLANVRAQIHEAARAIYAARAIDRGITDPGSGDGEALFREAVAAALGQWAGERGGIGRWNGRTLILPQHMTAGDLRTTLRALDDGDLEAVSLTGGLPMHETAAGQMRPATAGDVRDGFLVTIGHGRYQVSMTDAEAGWRFLVDNETGAAWVLDLSDRSLMDRVRANDREEAMAKAARRRAARTGRGRR